MNNHLLKKAGISIAVLAGIGIASVTTNKVPLFENQLGVVAKADNEEVTPPEWGANYDGWTGDQTYGRVLTPNTVNNPMLLDYKANWSSQGGSIQLYPMAADLAHYGWKYKPAESGEASPIFTLLDPTTGVFVSDLTSIPVGQKIHFTYTNNGETKDFWFQYLDTNVNKGKSSEKLVPKLSDFGITDSNSQVKIYEGSEDVTNKTLDPGTHNLVLKTSDENQLPVKWSYELNAPAKQVTPKNATVYVGNGAPKDFIDKTIFNTASVEGLTWTYEDSKGDSVDAANLTAGNTYKVIFNVPSGYEFTKKTVDLTINSFTYTGADGQETTMAPSDGQDNNVIKLKHSNLSNLPLQLAGPTSIGKYEVAPESTKYVERMLDDQNVFTFKPGVDADAVPEGTKIHYIFKYDDPNKTSEDFYFQYGEAPAKQEITATDGVIKEGESVTPDVFTASTPDKTPVKVYASDGKTEITGQKLEPGYYPDLVLKANGYPDKKVNLTVWSDAAYTYEPLFGSLMNKFIPMENGKTNTIKVDKADENNFAMNVNAGKTAGGFTLTKDGDKFDIDSNTGLVTPKQNPVVDGDTFTVSYTPKDSQTPLNFNFKIEVKGETPVMKDFNVNDKTVTEGDKVTPKAFGVDPTIPGLKWKIVDSSNKDVTPSGLETSNLTSGKYTVSFTADGYNPSKTVSLTVNLKGDTAVPVKNVTKNDNETVNLADFGINQTIPGLKWTITKDGSPYITNGTPESRTFPSGNYTVTFTADGYKFTPATVDMKINATSVTPTPNPGDNTGGGGSTVIVTPGNNTGSTSNNGSTSTNGNQTNTNTNNGSGTTTDTNKVPTGAVKKNTAVYAIKKIYLYKNTTFNKKDRIAVYNKAKRTNRPMFVVTDYGYSKAGRLRYKVRDVNHKSKTAGKVGYITANKGFVLPVYYRALPKSKVVTVISKGGVKAYKNKNLTGHVKSYKKGTILKVKKIERYNLTSRFVLSNGYYITGNKKLVIGGRY
ncbi:DUF5776 domain-containing protein [Lentilactobacillus sp. Marseille-Q4993]|uniref:DUF5776 domain-containing protein n=1 Tax=Lentilactobacillus sp. Marseille-Q4993 TaxID=3039492 RepID=UPI0024BC2468|nr:DUF5776 domain-containing protein [Lentilactobacillus sp. Marseille-Q4993]